MRYHIYMADIYTPLVSDLLESFEKGEMSLKVLCHNFNQRVRWDYDFLFPENRTKTGNNWQVVHDAFLTGKISQETYLFLVQSYEDYFAKKVEDSYYSGK